MKKHTRKYQVEAKLKYPEVANNGYVFEVHAKDRMEAIQKARKLISNEGHTRKHGRLSLFAVEIKD